MSLSHGMKYIQIIEYKAQMSEDEKDCLFSQLISCYIVDCKSPLMGLLLEGKESEFKISCKMMIKGGQEIKDSLTREETKKGEK